MQATAPLRSAASTKGLLKLFTTKKSSLTQPVGNCKAATSRLSCNFQLTFQGVICALVQGAASALTQTKGFSTVMGKIALQVASPSDAGEYVPF